jgi:hypothetical protein
LTRLKSAPPVTLGYRAASLGFCLVILVGCGVSTPPVRQPSPPEPSRFRPQDFLCRFAGGPAFNPDGSPGERARAPVNVFPGRRFTPAERRHARKLIRAELERFGLQAELHVYMQQDVGPHGFWWPEYGSADPLDDQFGYNLYAELPATEPGAPWVVVGAHYDSVPTGPGADDNASGVTATLMIANLMASLPRRPVNLLFVFFDQEELGLFGSYAFASKLAKEKRQIRLFHNLDMVGWDSDGDRVVEIAFGYKHGYRAPSKVMDRYRAAADRLRRFSSADSSFSRVAVRQTDHGRSDHVSFLRHELPAIMISEEHGGGDATPYYHQPQDTCDRVDYSYLSLVAHLVVTAILQP